CVRHLAGAMRVLTVVHINLLCSKIKAQPQSHVNATTRTPRNVTVTTNWRRNAVGNARRRAQRLCDRREDSRLTAEEEDGARRAGATLRTVAGVALEARKGPPVPDAADAAANR